VNLVPTGGQMFAGLDDSTRSTRLVVIDPAAAGRRGPAGRLPVTFFRSVNDLPPFYDYAMAGCTCQFFGGVPPYPFGFGLSYTMFGYRHLRTSADTVATDGTLTASVDVTNTGARAGDEVVQLYVRQLGSGVERLRKDLRGFRRATRQRGETRTAIFPLAAWSLAYWGTGRHGRVIEAEPVLLEVGVSSADMRLTRQIVVGGG